ncbi:hypothetical protein DCAR_0519132 [Daucus carota subsp. sativus]|uniref:Uncharacterized protein n=1 Tax=Daucus carota subsp. sativus TaxID=79200 RepID=A0AAF0X3H6_DAUCS|nr:hypothetical protein DCAR_0519132 [Daucus carota subsp. sativus]
MACKVMKSVTKSVAVYQYPWQEQLMKHQDDLLEGVWGYWHLGVRKKKGMRTKRKGHKCERISAEKRAHTAELMQKMPQMLADFKKRRWERKMNEDDSEAKKT